MIVVAAKRICEAGKRDAFIQAAQPCIEATRREDGCISYTLYAGTEDDTSLLYYEQWTTREALQRHLESDHLRAFGKLAQEQGLSLQPAEVVIYDAAVID